LWRWTRECSPSIWFGRKSNRPPLRRFPSRPRNRLKERPKEYDMVTPLPAAKALDSYFLEARSKLLDLAAILDRIGRGRDATDCEEDPRLEKIRRGVEVLHDRSGGRAERIQQIFSLDYDPSWERPKPR